MITRVWAATAGIPVALSLAVAVAFRAAEVASGKPSTAQAQSTPEAHELPLPELVANLIKNGNQGCPEAGSLRYEACLLYQGSLGVWRNAGFSESCPGGAADPNQVRDLQPIDALNAPKSACFRSIYAVMVANATPILSSTPLRVYYLTSASGVAEPGSNPELCIQVRHGICGNQAAVGLAFLQLAQIEARTVKFFYKKQGSRRSHINVEAMIGGRWRLIDTTYGAYWKASPNGKAPFSLASTDQVLADGEVRAAVTYNTALIPYNFYETVVPFDRFEFLTSDADIIRGESGTVSIDILGKQGIENFGNLPNYLGDTVPGRPFTGLDISLEGELKSTPINVTVDVSESAIEGNKPVSMCIDRQCLAFNKDVKVLSFRTSDPERLYLKTENDVAYVVLKSIRWETASDL